MTAATLLAEIEQADGEIWTEGDRLKFRAVPARLIPAIREHKGALLSAPAHDDYATEERLAIQEESAEVSTTPDKPVPSLEEQAEAILDSYGAGWQRGVDDLRIVAKNPVLAALVEKMGIDATQPARVDSGQDMPLPERVTCGQCVRFQQGPQPLAIGRCLATVTGQPPAGNRGDYRAAFPMAPRSCPEYRGAQS
ncbi:hypothetical protein HAP93_04540 [Acidithiobacillus ferriphilus]|uniref:hypothetical protein n=1 Tax=Acidithiobacillus ferriphilus TaxID=1689834 RepID=UPI001C0618F4|nr:hypothetical protein [Acidithiobacillus ferriphilus]MBU2785039.1 hypothetical protein [Acidithiobacillus ferriphilus]UEP59375.1 hypothetical protein K1Y48_01530 [Acidithiobacillus ferriphilus]